MRVKRTVATLTVAVVSALLVSPTVAASPSDLPADIPVSQILSLAASALSSGSSRDALEYYGLAIDRDPQNYLTVFKRGATYLSLGKSTQALADFNKVLEIKPGFEGALTQRAKLKARTGDWKDAKQDYIAAKKTEEVKALEEAEQAVKLSKDAERKKDWEGCATHASTALMVAGGALDLRQRRARCRFESGDILEALGDLRHLLQLNLSATKPALQISAMMFYSIGETDKGVEAIKQCLHSDPDSRECIRMFKRQKKTIKAITQAQTAFDKRSFSTVVKLLTPSGSEDRGLIESISDDMHEYKREGIIHAKAGDGLVTRLNQMACDSFIEMNSHKRGGPYCTALLAADPNALSGLLHKAQALLDSDDFEGAVRVLNQAKEHNTATQKLKEMLQKAHTLLKRSKTKDYYKVLAVERDASPKEIKRAFLKLSKQHHPDKVANPDARPAAEQKMAQINEAYEVLSDPELKERFDRGDDPNDPTGGRGGPGGNPFGGGAGGGHPFAQFFGGPGGGGGGGHQQFVFRSGPGGGGGGGGMPNFGGPGQGGFHFNF